MRHGAGLRKLNRTASHRRAMFRNMATSLLLHERYETTLPKAKEIRSIVEKLITLGREDTLHRRRKAYGYLQSKDVVHKLFASIGPRYKSRPGGYTRVVRTRLRVGDAAQMAMIELVRDGKDLPTEAPSTGKKKKSADAKKKPAKEAKVKEAKAEDAASAPKAKAKKAPAKSAEKAEAAPKKTRAKKAE